MIVDSNSRASEAASPVDMGIAAIWLAVGLFAVLMCIVVAYLGSTDAPYWDQWFYTDPSDYLRHPLQLNNGQHPILIGRLLFALDYYLFDAHGWFLQLIIFVAMAGEALAFILLARLGGIRDLCGTLIVAGFATTMVFNPLVDENITWAFQPPFVFAFSAGVGAAYGLAAYAVERRRWALALSLVLSAVALASLANGVIISVLLVFLALFLKLPRRIVSMHASIVLLAVLFFLGPGTERGALLPLHNFAGAFVPYVLAYMGGSIGRVPGHLWPNVSFLEPIAWSLCVGLALFVGATIYITNTTQKNPRDAASSALSTLILYIFLTACLTAVGRLFFGLQSAISGRYASASDVLVAALCIGSVLLWRQADVPPQIRRVLLLVGAGLTLLVPLSGLDMVRQIPKAQRDFQFAQTALITGVPDVQEIISIAPFFNVALTVKASAKLKTEHKWLFSDQWSRAIGERRNFSSVPNCGVGEIDIKNRQPQFLRVEGWVDGREGNDGRIVVITQSDGQIVGYGVVSKSASDLIGDLLFSPARREWRGHVRIDQNGMKNPLSAYLANPHKIMCRIATKTAS